MIDHKNIIFILFIGYLSACTPGEKRHIGQWEINIEDQTIGTVVISEGLIAFFEYYESECDTSFHQTFLFDIESSDIQGNVTILKGRSSDDDIINLELKFKDIVSGVFCIIGENDNLDCGIFEKSSYDLNLKMNKEEKDIYDYKYTIAREIKSIQNKIDILRQDKPLSKQSLDLLNYIDSLEKQLLLQYDLNYSTIKCWHKLDSLTSSYTSSIYLLGDEIRLIDPKYNAHELEKKLTIYLKNKSEENGIELIFPTFKRDIFIEYSIEGKKISWSVNRFFLASLGTTVKELEDLKLKIIQVELLDKY